MAGDFETDETTEYVFDSAPTTPLWPATAKLEEPRDAQREWLGQAEKGTVLL